MAGQIWFGTRDFATWVPAPSVSNYSTNSANWSSKVSFLNGGANVRRSFGSHREYSMSWAPTKQYKLSPIMDFAHGLHGEGLIYWSDPFAEYTNILPKEWATPQLGARDGVNITGRVERPTLAPSSANMYGFPTQSALTLAAVSTAAKRAVILVPPGMDFIMRAYGSETGGTARYYTKKDSDSHVSVPWSAVNDLNSINIRRIAGGTTGAVVEVFLTGSPAGTAQAVITGAMAQIVPSGSTPLWERFVSGQGASGCRFDGNPATSPYSAALDLVGMSANLVEVGAWL